jgi:hypothetical protein
MRRGRGLIHWIVQDEEKWLINRLECEGEEKRVINRFGCAGLGEAGD